MLHLRIVRALAKVAVSRACFLSNTVKFPGLVLNICKVFSLVVSGLSSFNLVSEVGESV